MTTSQHIEDFGELAPATDDGKVVVAGGGGRVLVVVVAVAGRQVAAFNRESLQDFSSIISVDNQILKKLKNKKMKRVIQDVIIPLGRFFPPLPLPFLSVS